MNPETLFGLYTGGAVACGLFAFASLITAMFYFDRTDGPTTRANPRPRLGVTYLVVAAGWIIGVGYFAGQATGVAP